MCSSPPLSLVILAAGASQRLGCCKALVPLGGGVESSPLARLLASGQSLGPSRSLIVSGRHQREIAAFQSQHAPAAELLHNPAWAQGRSGGIRRAHLSLPMHDICLAPVDVPLVEEQVFAALAGAWRAAGAPPMGWLAPALENAAGKRHGHPIILGRGLLALLDSDRDDRPLRELRGQAQPLWDLLVKDRSILDDLDEPADLERLRARLRP